MMMSWVGLNLKFCHYWVDINTLVIQPGINYIK